MSDQPGYQRGDRIALEYTDDPHTRLQPGDEGTVTSYYLRHGQLNVRWDSGSTLAMLLGDGDRVHLINPAREHPGPEGGGPRMKPSTTHRNHRTEGSHLMHYTRERDREATSGENPQPGAPAASITAEAGNLGRDAGKAAASWMFDGSTPDDTYRAVLRGIDDGDPAILGAHPAPGLSASGGYAEADLARDLGLDDDQLPPDAVTAYLHAAEETFWHETERIAREHLAASTTEGRPCGNGTEPGR
jgi:Domain of unknown function (DUF4314)